MAFEDLKASGYPGHPDHRGVALRFEKITVRMDERRAIELASAILSAIVGGTVKIVERTREDWR